MAVGSFSDYLEKALLDLQFGKTAYVPTANLYIGLSTADPTDTGGGIAEPAAGAYDRVTVANDKTTWSVAVLGAGTLSNAIKMTFPTATASWGICGWFIIMNNTKIVGGDLIAYGPLTHPKTVDIDDTLDFEVGDLVISLD